MCSILIVFTILTHVQAQEDFKSHKGLYFGFKAGYTIPVAKSTIGSPRSEVGDRLLMSSTDGDYQLSEQNPFGSRGAGGQIAASLGYMFNNNFGMEMEFSFLRTTRILDASRNETTVVNGIVQNYFAEQYSYTNMFRALPMLVVSGNQNKKFVPYAKFGVLLPLVGKTIVEVNVRDETGEIANRLLPILNPVLSNSLDSILSELVIPTESFIRAKTSGAFSIGFAARMGCNFNINERWALFGEMEMNMLTIKAKETEFIDFSSSVSNEGLVFLAEQLLEREIQSTFGFYDLPEIIRLTTYQDEITQASNSSYDVNSPNFDSDSAFNQVNFRDNANSFGLMLGFRYKFK
jgi:hypothetical protein